MGGQVERRVVRELFRVIGQSAAVPRDSLDHLADLAVVVERRGPVDPSLLDAIEELTAGYAERFESAPPEQLLDLVRAHVNHIGARMDRPMSPSLQARLGSLAAEAAALAGWLAYLAGRRGEARSYFSFARDAARDADDPTLHALALGSMAALFSAVSSGTSAGSLVAARLLQQAVALVPADAPPTARAWLAGRLAAEHALLGDRQAFGRCLGRSGAALAEAAPETGRVRVFDARGVLSFWGHGGIGEEHAAGFGGAVLGDRRAVDRLAGAVAAVPSAVGRSNVLADLATAHLLLGDVDAAAQAAVRALRVAAPLGYGARAQRVAGLRDRMPSAGSAVVALDEQLALTG